MMPLLPDVTVRPLAQQDTPALVALLNPLLSTALYSRTMDHEMALAQALRRHPHTVFPTRLQQNQCLGAWRAGQLIAVVDVAVGFDCDTLDLPDYLPIGLLRFLVLPERSDLVSEAASSLLSHAEEFWRSVGVGHVKAFHISTGYPAFQAGAGLLPGDWGEHVRVLTEHGFQFSNRYYAVHRLLSDPSEEYLALADLGVVFRGTVDDRNYTIYHRRTEQIASARLVRAEVDRDGVVQVVGLIPAMHVDPHWRQRDLGKWLLSRMINDGLLQQYDELVAFVSMDQNAAMNLFTQWGFEELHYRGYVLEKDLTS